MRRAGEEGMLLKRKGSSWKGSSWRERVVAPPSLRLSLVSISECLMDASGLCFRHMLVGILFCRC